MLEFHQDVPHAWANNTRPRVRDQTDGLRKLSIAAAAHSLSWAGVPELTPTAPTTWPSTRTGIPPATIDKRPPIAVLIHRPAFQAGWPLRKTRSFSLHRCGKGFVLRDQAACDFSTVHTLECDQLTRLVCNGDAHGNTNFLGFYLRTGNQRSGIVQAQSLNRQHPIIPLCPRRMSLEGISDLPFSCARKARAAEPIRPELCPNRRARLRCP